MIREGVCGKLKYIMYAPSTFGGKPLIVVLHGSGEVGKSLAKLKKREPYISLKNGMYRPNAVVLMPQLPKGSWGKMAAEVRNLVDTVADRYRCDKSRISITGHSLGGMGVIEILCKYPSYFSAGATLSCAKNYKGEMHKIAHIPMWFLYGEKEKVYGRYAREMYAVMDKLNEEARITPIKGYGHPIQFAWCNSKYGIFEWLAHYWVGDMKNPSWGEWLTKNGIVDGNTVTACAGEPIPETIMVALGIKKGLRP